MSLDGINGRSIQTLLRGENDSKQSDEFQARILLRNEKTSQETNKPDTTSIHNEYLTSKEMVKKLKEQKEKLDHKDNQLFFATSTAIRLRIRAGSLRDKLREYCRRGSVKAICFKLQRAAD